jgi:homoserine O-succinyltransferase
MNDDALVDGMPARWYVPHSRQNTLAAPRLVDAGYIILSSAAEVGVDMFARRRGSVFLFLQGHPEYDAGTLLREYQRDITRYLMGMTDRYPDMPRGYLSSDTIHAFCAFQRAAMRNRGADLLAGIPTAMSEPAQPWRAPAIRLYSNWLSLLS